MSTQPTVGRIVHYRSFGTPGGEYPPTCRAAVVAEVPSTVMDPETGRQVDNTVGEAVINLCVLNPTGIFFDQCAHDEEKSRGGTWHWPCIIAKEEQ